MTDIIAIVVGLATWFMVGKAIGGAKGLFVGGLCGFVAFIVAGLIAMGREQAADAEAKQERERAEDDHFRELYSAETLDKVIAGRCPDCGYVPISTSCVACPRCGCRSFVRALRGRKMAQCTDCSGLYAHRCESCGGNGRIVLVQAVDFRSGAVIWETSRSLALRETS